tara:strand:+ start:695 stop:871 length:177 start_codon:yes stop_codon:yes gene_type:complete
MWFSIFALPSMVGYVAYKVGYRQGYGHGDHAGFSRGLWKATDRRNKTNVKPRERAYAI